MKCISTYFRAVNDYRKNTNKQTECVKKRKNIAEADRENDFIEVERVKCTIDTDWVDEIEKGLVFVEKALKEERQFIRSNGEVIPIEKVKHVSKNSVEHLARHSDLITRFNEDEDLVPDKIYTVEKLSDYSVYENRFLYMMLCYLRDFVSLRYSLIVDAVNTYKGKARLKKTIKTSKGELNFCMDLSEVSYDDEYLREHNDAKEVLDRIDLIYRTIVVFLSYPLMTEVKKSPMLKPPITKTNVLKMNFNFKGALALYEYISAYNGNGYTLHTEVNTVKNFKNSAAEDFAELVGEASFLTYEYGLGVREYLKEEFEKEEVLRREEEQRKLVEQIENLRKRVKESGMGMEEYMLLLEKRNRVLQQDSDRLAVEKKKNEQLTAELEEKNKTIEKLTCDVEELTTKLAEEELRHQKEVAELKQSFAAEKEAMENAHREEIDNLNAKHAEEINSMLSAHEEEIARLNETHKAEVDGLNAAHVAEVETLKTAHEDELTNLKKAHEDEKAQIIIDKAAELCKIAEGYEKRIADAAEESRVAAEKAADEIRALENENDKLVGDNEEKLATINKINSDNVILKAKINALKHRYDAYDGNENYCEENNFDDIEKQYEEFRKFFKEVWKKTKLKIKKESKESMKRGLDEEKARKVGRKTLSDGATDEKTEEGFDETVREEDKKAN